MNLKERLNSILDKASIPEKTKILWNEAFKYLKIEEVLFLINELEKASIDEIQKLSENLKRKVEALENKDMSLWREIIEEEKSLLS
jgi:hypothetical protein